MVDVKDISRGAAFCQCWKSKNCLFELFPALLSCLRCVISTLLAYVTNTNQLSPFRQPPKGQKGASQRERVERWLSEGRLCWCSPDCTETHNGVIPTEKHMHFRRCWQPDGGLNWMGNGNGSAGGAWIRGAPIAGGAERCWRPQQRSHCDEMDGEGGSAPTASR